MILPLPVLAAAPAVAGTPYLSADPCAAAVPTRVEAGLFSLPNDGLLYVPEGAVSGDRVPLLVLLHGAGGTAASILGRFHREAAARGIILLAVKSRGSTWDLIGGRVRAPSGGAASRIGAATSDYAADVPRIDDALARTFRRVRVAPGRIALAGFSDGASYALSVGIANPRLFGNVLAFSPGMAALPGRRAGEATPQTIFVSHGRSDTILSYRYTADRIVPTLRSAGSVTFRTFAGGHTIPADVGTEALDLFLSSRGGVGDCP